jgi:ADP-ribose pyrophosphatase
MPYESIENQVIFEGARARLEVHHLRDEESGKRIRREVIVHPGAVVVLPLLDADTVVLIKQRRYAIDRELLELPAGTLEKGEPPMNCAGRELLEETGYLAGRIQALGNFFSSPGILTEKMYAYVAYDLERKQQKLDDGEEIELLKVGFTEAVAMIRTGEIADAKSIATLLMDDRFYRGE